MEVRKLQTGEHIDTRFLYENVFPGDSKAFVDYYYSEKIRGRAKILKENAYNKGELRWKI